MSTEKEIKSMQSERKTLILALVAGMCSDALLSWLTMSLSAFFSVCFDCFSTLGTNALPRVFNQSCGGRDSVSQPRLFLRGCIWSLCFRESALST